MFDKLNFYGKNSFTVDRIFKFMEVVMFKWHKKIFSLLVVIFIFSFGFNCSAIEDYLMYFGCEEKNCSNCGKSLAYEFFCISDEKNGIIYDSDNCYRYPRVPIDLKCRNVCFIHFKRSENSDNVEVDIDKIYNDKDHYYCRKCMLQYLAACSYNYNYNYNNFPCEYSNLDRLRKKNKCSQVGCESSSLVKKLLFDICNNGHSMCDKHGSDYYCYICENSNKNSNKNSKMYLYTPSITLENINDIKSLCNAENNNKTCSNVSESKDRMGKKSKIMVKIDNKVYKNDKVKKNNK